MKHAMRLAILPAVISILAALTASGAYAQAGPSSGYSVHGKTPPANPPATQEEAEPKAEAAEQPPAADEQTQTGDAPAEAVPETPAKPESQAAAPEQPNALGATSGWETKFGTAPPQTSAFTGAPEQMAVIEKINAYFNEMTNLEGAFLQTDADDKRRKGKFFIERPGKVLFDYSLPSKQKIISNGEYLAIEDHDLNTTDRYPLESTPFRLLLKEQVDLAKDARIVALDVGEKIVVLTVEDKEGRGGGQIRLFFDWPEMQLREWIITDAQGLNTRIELAELETNKEVDPKLFKFSPDVGMPKFR